MEDSCVELKQQADSLAVKEQPAPKRVFTVDGVVPSDANRPRDDGGQDRWDGTLNWEGTGFLAKPDHESSLGNSAVDRITAVNPHYRTGITEAFLRGESTFNAPIEPQPVIHPPTAAGRLADPPKTPSDFHTVRGEGDSARWARKCTEDAKYDASAAAVVAGGAHVDGSDGGKEGLLSAKQQESLLEKHATDPTLSVTDPTALLGIHLGIADADPKPAERPGSASRVSRVVSKMPLSFMSDSVQGTQKGKPVVFST